MGRVRNVDKFYQDLCSGSPLARATQATLIVIVNIDLSVLGLLSFSNHHYPFYPQ